MNIDPRHLIQLYTIVEAGSFVAAADQLGLTQPGLTRNIHLLEARVGVRLLVRGRHGALATDEGKALAGYGRWLRDLTHQAGAISTSLQRGEVGELRLGAAYAIANSVISEPISQFLAARPHTSIRVLPGPTPRLLEELDAGRLDLVLGGTQLLTEQHGMRFEPLMENELVVIGRLGHPLAGLDAVPVERLAKQRWIICLPQDPLRIEVENGMATLGLSRDAVAIETGSSSLAVDVLLRTDFLAMVPSVLADPLAADDKVRRLNLASRLALRPLGVAYRINGKLPPVAKAFVKVLNAWSSAKGLKPNYTGAEQALVQPSVS